MGLISWLFGGETNSTEYMNIQGSGTYPIDIVGASKYQEALGSIFGDDIKDGEDESGKIVRVKLVHEDDNPQDREAIRVDVEEQTVGYLSPELSAKHRARLRQGGLPDATVTCSAIITEEADRNGDNKKVFSIKLDLP